MIPTFFLMGPSDIEGQSWTKKERLENGKVRGAAQWSGFLPIAPFIMADATLSAKSTFVMIGIHETLKLPADGRLNVFNLVGDADASPTTLKTIQALENKIQPRRYFNRASDVLKTSRERLPITLFNIPGCRVPRVKALNPGSFDEFISACEEFGAWPLIVRARGYHGGEYMLLLEDKSQLGNIKDEPWIYNGVFLIEYFDYRNEQGLYQKSRVIMVDGVPYPRHSIFSDKWAVHAASRVDLMGQDIELCQQEERFLAYLNDDGIKGYGEIFNAIQERIGLDIFGIDFALVDGKMVVFEANVCMNFLGQNYGEHGRYQYLEGYVTNLKRAVKKMLLNA